MKEETKNFTQVIDQIKSAAIKPPTSDTIEIKQIKQTIQENYTQLYQFFSNKTCFNFGIWDKKIDTDYRGLNFNCSTLSPTQDINSELLLYSLIRPLVQREFFNKRLLDIGCSSGIGLNMSSQLLHTQYALGVDLVSKSVSISHNNFYEEDKVNYMQADAEHLPLNDESFDIITNLESSHLYPQIEYFFSEVERVLAPGGYFCYADIYLDTKRQAKKLDAFLALRKNLRVVQKVNLTKMIQKSIYKRIFADEKAFFKFATSILSQDNKLTFLKELDILANLIGISFLPWWKIWARTSALRPIAKEARKVSKSLREKLYFYYLIQKI